MTDFPAEKKVSPRNSIRLVPGEPAQHLTNFLGQSGGRSFVCVDDEDPFAHRALDGSVSLARLCQPRVEPEAVFGMKSTPRVDASLDDLFDALEWVAPGFEVVQSHRPGWKFTAPETVADGGLHASLLVGPKVPIAELARDAQQLQDVLSNTRLRLSQSWSTVASRNISGGGVCRVFSSAHSRSSQAR